MYQEVVSSHATQEADPRDEARRRRADKERERQRDYRHVAIDRASWASLCAEAGVVDLTGNKLAGLILRNWLRSRWPLALIPEKRREKKPPTSP